jgi:hypothetical protein
MPAPVCKAALHGACINTQSKTNAKGWRVPLSASHQCCAEATADLPQLCELYLGKQSYCHSCMADKAAPVQVMHKRHSRSSWWAQVSRLPAVCCAKHGQMSKVHPWSLPSAFVEQPRCSAALLRTPCTLVVCLQMQPFLAPGALCP